MTWVVRTVGWLLLLAALLPAAGFAAELEPGVNQASVIKFPTALNQTTTNTARLSVELTDVAKPELHLYNVGYGFQHGAFQLLADLNYAIEPVREFDYAEVRAKLQILSLDEFRSYVAVGLLGRAVEQAEERPARIDDKPASLFVISSFELFPFQRGGGMLVNLYLDNRFLTLGLKLQVYEGIQFVGEWEHLVSTERTDKNNGRAGVSFETLHNFYFQLLWTDQGKHALAQVGTGF